MRQSQAATPAARIGLGVVPVNKGGTGATTIFGAVLNLGGVYIPNLDLALSVAKLTAGGKVNPLHLPDAMPIGPTLSGLTSLYQGQLTTYQITNYDSSTAYTASVDVGVLVNLTGDTLTYQAPAVNTLVTLTVNGRSVPVQVTDPWPLKPTVVATTTGTVSSATGIATGSAFAMIGGAATHRQSDWQLASDANFTNLILTTQDDTINLTSWSPRNLSFSTTYYVRARYRASNLLYSEWSDAVQFTTAANYTPDAEEAKLIASDKASSDDFGWAVAMDSTATRVVVGAYLNDETLASNCGAVYVFRRNGTTWTQEQKMEESGFLVNNVYVGYSVDIDNTGTRIVAGAYGYNGSRGCVFVYLRTNTTWAREAQLTMADQAGNDKLGWSVACDATCTWLAAGAPERDVTGSANAGSVCIFSRSGTTWSAGTRLIASDKAANDYLGWSVAIDGTGTRVLSGAYLEDPSSVSAAGAVYVYVRNPVGNTWQQEAKLVPSDRETNGQFGYSVAVNYNGTRAVIGANQATAVSIIQAGAVYVYERSGVTWTQGARLVAFDRGAGDTFGCSVDINAEGDKVIVGSLLADVSALTTAGAAYVFTLVGAAWVQEAKLTASDKATGDNFGCAVAISGEGGRAVVGAWQEDPGGTNNAGSAYVYS